LWTPLKKDIFLLPSGFDSIPVVDWSAMGFVDTTEKWDF